MVGNASDAAPGEESYRIISGLEVAGVVLGALPLVVAALQCYAEGVTTARRFYRYQACLGSMIALIETERTIFLNTVELQLVYTRK